MRWRVQAGATCARPTAASTAPSSSYPSTWYAFDAGVARFYVLETAWADGNPGLADSYTNDYDTHWAPSTPQYQWLEQD